MHRSDRSNVRQLGVGACCLCLGVLVGTRLPGNSADYSTDSAAASSHFPRGPIPSGHDQQVLAEMAVHPGMLAANPPGTVAVVLAEDAASHVICEVLKHRSVHRVLLFPPASSVAPPSGFSTSWPCADDSRVAETQWKDATASECKSVDVLIIDALPIGDTVPTSTVNAVETTAVWSSIKCLLKDEATVMFQLGPAPTVWKGSQSPSAKATTAEQLQLITKFGTDLSPLDGKDDDDEGDELNVHIFDTFVAVDNKLRSYAVVCKQKEAGVRWNRNEAAVEFSIQRRMQPPAHLERQQPAFRMLWYDGPTHVAIATPSRGWEDAFCSAYKDADTFCHSVTAPVVDAVAVQQSGHDDINDDPELSAVQYKLSGRAAAAGETIKDMGMFATRDMKKGSRLLFDPSTGMEIPDHLWHGLERLAKETGNEHFQNILDWAERYGFGCVGDGGERSTWISVASRMTMVNHACTAEEGNIGYNYTGPEAEVPVWDVASRRHTRSQCMTVFLLRDVKKGEQLMEDYGRYANGDAKLDAVDSAKYAAWCKKPNVVGEAVQE